MKTASLSLRFWQKVTVYLADFAQAQCIATMICLPFLVCWGLPISIMSFVGNLIFTPFLAFFLLLSSLVFFTELLSIPNMHLVCFLDGICSLWQSCLSCGRKEWMLGFCKPPFFFLLALPLFTLLLLKRFKNPSQATRLLAMTVCCSLGLFGLSVYSYIRTRGMQPPEQTLHKKLTVERGDSGRVTISDEGFFTKRMNLANAVTFRIRPHLYQNYGTTDIDCFTILKPGMASFKGVIELNKMCKITRVHLPYFEQELSKQDWYFFFEMKRALERDGVEFVRRISHV